MIRTADLHAHVIPGVDDGPPETGLCLELLSRMADAGTAVCAATPHYIPPVYDLAGLKEKFAALESAVAGARIPVKLVLGAENSLYPEIQADADAGRLLTTGTARSVLLEMPMGPLPPRFREFVFSLAARGYRPVLAHPERSPAFSNDPRQVRLLRESGAAVQITAGSLSGDFGREERNFARALLREGLVDVIASDAHGSPWRPLNLVEAAEEAGRWCGSADAAEAMVSSTPLKLLGLR